MKRYSPLILMALLLACKGGVHQEIILLNKSKSNIFYCIHRDSIPNITDIQKIRPWSDERIKEHHRHLKFDSVADSLENAKGIKTAYLIRPENREVIFTSRGIMIFNDKESIQEQIKNEYNGRLYVSVITEDNLKKHSNMKIINNGLYDRFLALGVEDIKKDTMVFVYK